MTIHQRSVLAAVLLCGPLCGSLGCHEHGMATAEECRAIVRRLVALELRERGYQDDTLAERKATELMANHDTLMADCPGKAIPRHAMECLKTARSSAEVIRTCLGIPDH